MRIHFTGSSMTPTAYQRIHASSKRGPSSLRQSFTASQGQRIATNGHGGNEDDESDDEADAEEVRQIMVSASQQKRSARPSGRKSIAAGSRIQQLGSEGEESGQEYDGERRDDGQENYEEEDHARASSGKSKGKGRASMASPRSSRRDSGRSPLLKLGKNGNQVHASKGGRQRGSSSSLSPPKKGKGKGKEVARHSSLVEEEEMPPFEDGDDQDNEYSDDGQQGQYDNQSDQEEREEEPVRGKGKGRNLNAATASNSKKKIAVSTKNSRKRPRAESYDEDGGEW
jgi:hypothetical protein